MPFEMDPLFRELDGHADDTVGSQGGAIGLRAVVDRLLVEAFDTSAPAPDVQCQTFSTRSDDGADISMRWYTRSGASPGSAVIFAHGGGMIAGSVAIYDAFVRQHVQWTGVPMLSVEYRLAPEATGDTPVRDVFAALSWLAAEAPHLGIDPARIALMGDSAGGGIAAGTAILARDRGMRIAAQLLIFPMLDDRTVLPDPHLSKLATWTYDDNRTGWDALLADRRGTADVSPYCAPARLVDFDGLPRTYIEVGSLDIFRDECIEYALALLRTGVECELHVHPGAPHGYDTMALQASFSARWRADRIRALTSI